MIDQIVGLLASRLEIEQWYARHPEIDDQEIVAPLFGLGLPRTGSTALSFLLACDTARRSLAHMGGGEAVPAARDGHRAHGPSHRRDPGGHRHHQRDVPRIRRHVAHLRHGATGMHSADGPRLQVAALRGNGPDPVVQRVAPHVRHGARLPLPPAGPATPAVAVPTRAVVAQDAGSHAFDRRARPGSIPMLASS